MAARADDDFYIAEQLREITHCSTKLAEILLSDTNNDLMEAVEKFYGESDVGLEKGDRVGNCREDRFGHEIVGTGDGNLNRVTVKKQRYPQVGEVDSSCNKNPVVDVHGIVTTRPRLKRRMGKKKAKDAEIKGFHDMNGKFSDMKMMNKARPTKEDKFSQLRQELLAYLWEVTTTAGVDEAELMVLEDCPACGFPQILQDKTVRLFQCVEGCPAIFCRNCKVYHEPLSCKHWKNGVFGEMEHELEMYVVDITKVESGRLFENDNLKAEYQMVEGEFLRMMASIGKSLKITRIDMVNNMQLKKKFEMKKIRLQYEGLSDTAVLLFHATDDVAVEDVIKNNFAQVHINYYSSEVYL